MHVTSPLATDLHAGIKNAITVTALASTRIEGKTIRTANLSINEEEDVAVAESAASGIVDEEVSWAANGKIGRDGLSVALTCQADLCGISHWVSQVDCLTGR